MHRYPVEKGFQDFEVNLNPFCFENEYSDYKKQLVRFSAFVSSVFYILTSNLFFDFEKFSAL